MKIGTFVIGAIAGAAVVMMIQRNQTMSAVAANVGSNMKRRMNHMKDDVVGKAINNNFASSFKRATNSEKHETSSSPYSSAHGSSHGTVLDEVENLISQDAELSNEINAILKQNGQHQM